MKYLFFFLLFSVNVFAQGLHYLKPDSVDVDMVPAPPSLNSQEDLKDLETVLLLQDERSAEECARATFEAEGFATNFFGDPYGPLTTAEAQRLVDFQERLFKEVNYFSRILKNRFARKRPFDRDERVKPCIPTHSSNSYPSGHAAISVVAASAFSILYPEKIADFKLRSEIIAWDRVLGGVHYPSDIEAGKVLGELVFEALMKNEQFKKDLEALR